jgi:hypothetical protein
MWKTSSTVLLLLSVLHPTLSWSSDACSTLAIKAAADVTVSDGSSFQIETSFQSRDVSAIRHIRDPHQLIVVEGPHSWTQLGETATIGTDFHKLFALGHQFHAFLLRFEELVSSVPRREDVQFNGESRQAVGGDYPYGGKVYLIQGADTKRPMGLLFEFPEDTVISVKFDDWRDEGDVTLPFHLQIDDGQRVFDYHYSDMSITSESPLWFFNDIPSPRIDVVQVYRLHRKLLAAHCLGDADMIANLSAPEIISASRGKLEKTTNEAMRERFTALFQSLDYTEYHDLVAPAIELSEDATLGWIGANVEAQGTVTETGTSFSSQWAWIMMVRKINNVWLHAGNASNRAN